MSTKVQFEHDTFSMKQLIVVALLLTSMTWFLAKKYYEFKSEKEDCRNTYNSVIGTTSAILFAQFVWAKIKKCRFIKMGQIPIKRHGGPRQRGKDLFAAMKLESCGHQFW